MAFDKQLGEGDIYDIDMDGNEGSACNEGGRSYPPATKCIDDVTNRHSQIYNLTMIKGYKRRG